MTDYTARVSVIIPLYNKQKVVKRTIDSVLSQRYTDFEVIVVDDGSTDKGAKVVRQIQDSRIRLIDQTNSGVSAARNRGIREAKSELIAFLDADDEWLPDFLETVIQLSSRFSDAGAFTTGYITLKDGGKTYRNMTNKEKYARCGCYFDLVRKGFGVCSSSIAIRRQVFDKVGAFREGYRLAEDLDMWFRIGLRYMFACSPKICAIYHYYQSGNACRIAKPNKISPLYVSFLELRKNKQIDPVIKQKAEKYLSYHSAKDIEYIIFRGFRDISRYRLNLYQMQCGINILYIKLCLLNALPSFLLRSLAVLRLKLVQYLLMLRKNILSISILIFTIPIVQKSIQSFTT